MSEVTNGAKNIIKSKTMIVNILLFVVALVNLAQDSALIPAALMGWLFLVAAAANLALRYFFTDQPVKLK